MSSNYGARFARAAQELRAIRPQKADPQTDPDGYKHAIDALESCVSYDLSGLSAKLFPNGLVTDLDPTQPGWIDDWRAIRTSARPMLEEVFRDWVPGTEINVTRDGMTIHLTDAQLARMDLVTLPHQEFLDVFTRVGTGFFVPPINPRVSPSTRAMPLFDPNSRRNSRLPRDSWPWGISKVEYIKRYLHSRISDTCSDIVGTNDLSGFGQSQVTQPTLDVLVTLFDRLARMFWDREVYQAISAWDDGQRYTELLNAPPTGVNAADILKRKVAEGQARKSYKTSREDFISRPFLGRRALQSKTSRTYGVEFEVIDGGDLRWPDETKINEPGDLITARTVQLPHGWTKERDGSLRHQIGDGYFYDPWEFISPPMSRTFDPGMRAICEQIDWTVAYAKAGVHVHVDATNAKGQRMNTAQVGRVLEIYAQISPMLPPILRRHTTEFCEPMDFEEWATGWWRMPYTPPTKRHRQLRPAPALRAPLKNDPLVVVKERMSDYERHAPKNWGRYREVNLESLTKHGTIEFRAMGAVYGFEYISRWAWLCREIVNYAQSSLPVTPFYQATTLGQVLDHIEANAIERLAPIKERRRLPFAA